MTGVFRLLRLPWIVRNIIFKQFEFYDLFNISLCSKRCKTYVASLKLLKSLKMRIRRIDLWGIDLIDKPFNDIWRMDFEKRVKSKTRNEYGHRTVDGLNMRIRQDGKNFLIVEYGRKMKPPKLLAKTILDFFIAQFSFPIHDVFFRLDDFSELDYQMYRSIKEVESLTIYSDKCVVDENLLRDFLENVKIKDEFKINLRHPGSQNFQCELKLECDKFEIWSNARWMTADSFLGANCAKINLRNVQFTPNVYEDFVARWYYSDNTKLEMVHVWYKERWETSDFSRFSPKPWDPKQRDQIHREKNGSQMDFADGLDILRADGMLATIMDSPRDFHFQVWKQRFTVWNERED